MLLFTCCSDDSVYFQFSNIYLMWYIKYLGDPTKKGFDSQDRNKWCLHISGFGVTFPVPKHWSIIIKTLRQYFLFYSRSMVTAWCGSCSPTATWRPSRSTATRAASASSLVPRQWEYQWGTMWPICISTRKVSWIGPFVWGVVLPL